MKISRSISEPIRENISMDQRWKGYDSGFIACWERGREKSKEAPELARLARNGQLVQLPWKGGVEKALKAKTKVGTLQYLAMWQGLRGEDLHIDTEDEPTLRCIEHDVTVVFTNDYSKYSNA